MSASRQGRCRPEHAMSTNSPTVLMATVFPPVLGPVITIPRVSPPSLKSRGTLESPGSRGCLASFRHMMPWVLTAGSLASICALSFPLANTKSSFASRARFSLNPSSSMAILSISVYRIRLSSQSSSILSPSISSCILAMVSGSINTVEPLEDRSMVLPGILDLYSFLIGRHSRPFLVTRKDSAINFFCDFKRASALSLIFSSRSCRSRRISRSVLDARSSTLPWRIAPSISSFSSVISLRFSP